MGKAKVTVVEGTVVAAETTTVVVFKVNRVLTEAEYVELEKRVRAENEASGVSIVLAPFSVDAVVTETPVAVCDTSAETETTSAADATEAETK